MRTLFIESKYYHDIDSSAVFTVRCVKRENDPCARTLEGSLRIEDKYFNIVPVSDLSNVDRMYMNREYNDTPHVIQEETAIVENIILANDTIIPAVAEEEAIKKRIFVNHPRALHNLNFEKSDLYKNKRATTVYGVELLLAVDPPVWQKQVYPCPVYLFMTTKCTARCILRAGKPYTRLLGAVYPGIRYYPVKPYTNLLCAVSSGIR
ncbi:hypothetical protein CHS0354_027745 [Potamilus streckersoni]|uniref:Uncharacterized protein n=1 Tax=Potamilus streckersoni TaxID=2493646 RepID=A0AAE0TF18_9BIVA|nr:hypothetical protein CHS0354_027745 [Potamilus streckersoni]